MMQLLRSLPLLLLLWSGPAASQVNDFAVWTGFQAEYEFLSRFSAHVNEEFRFNENATELGSVFTDIGLDYKTPLKGFRVSMNGRFIQRRQLNDFYTPVNRLYFDFSYKKKFGPFAGTLRLRLQNQSPETPADDDTRARPAHDRWRFTLKYNNRGRRLEPFVYTEVFHNIRKKYTDQVRFAGGFDYKVNVFHSWSIAYLHQRELGARNPERDFVINVQYTLNLNSVFERIGNRNKIIDEVRPVDKPAQ
jgi:hypothetical protein